MGKYYTYGELSKKYGIPVSTLRFYCRNGLFSPEYTDENNGYAYFSLEHIYRLDLVTLLRELDMPLETIKRILTQSTGYTDVLEALKVHHEHLIAQIEIARFRADKIEEVLRLYDDLPYVDQPLGVVCRQSFPERRIFTSEHKPFSLTGGGGEFLLAIRHCVGSPTVGADTEEYPTANRSMGLISAVSNWQPMGAPTYQCAFLEPAGEHRSNRLKLMVFPPGDWLTVRFIDRQAHREEAYSELMRHLEGNSAGKILLEAILNSGIPPVNLQELIFELQVKLC